MKANRRQGKGSRIGERVRGRRVTVGDRGGESVQGGEGGGPGEYGCPGVGSARRRYGRVDSGGGERGYGGRS